MKNNPNKLLSVLLFSVFIFSSCEKKDGVLSSNTLIVKDDGVYSIRTKDNLTILNVIRSSDRIEVKIPADNPVGDIFLTKSSDSRTLNSIVITKLINGSLKIIKINEDGTVDVTTKPL